MLRPAKGGNTPYVNADVQNPSPDHLQINYRKFCLIAITVPYERAQFTVIFVFSMAKRLNTTSKFVQISSISRNRLKLPLSRFPLKGSSTVPSRPGTRLPPCPCRCPDIISSIMSLSSTSVFFLMISASLGQRPDLEPVLFEFDIVISSTPCQIIVRTACYEKPKSLFGLYTLQVCFT